MGAECTKEAYVAVRDRRRRRRTRYEHRPAAANVFKRVEQVYLHSVTERGKEWRCINEYKIVDQLASSGYSTVYKCSKLARLSKFRDRGFVVVKEVHNRNLRELSEMNLKNLDHPNLIKLIEVIHDPTHKEIYFVLEYLSHGPIMTLTPLGQASCTFPEEVTRSYAQQIANALHYLHSRNIVHHNLRPDNILLADDGATIKLADFLFSQARGTEDDTASRHERRHEVLPFFDAPEEVGEDGEFVMANACDIWSFGVTLFVLLFGHVPFPGTTPAEVIQNILHKAFVAPEETAANQPLPYPLRRLLRRMLEKNLPLRITLNEILDDPWMTGQDWNPVEQSATSRRPTTCRPIVVHPADVKKCACANGCK
eukprot:TRINITY_DN2905_c0_g1_i1.p1 TRINITY_DN2905_c0_g1~~TRINITY_DN2905_c0_g1_i1.p1  ORF type:complete len:368 (+),score=48.06 TRINITY_DN2905_c0_g1_i1:77-1180(+)